MIQTYQCKSEFQDKTYGKQQRVHTTSVKGEPRCTVCGPKARKFARLDIHAREHNPAIHNPR